MESIKNSIKKALSEIVYSVDIHDLDAVKAKLNGKMKSTDSINVIDRSKPQKKKTGVTEDENMLETDVKNNPWAICTASVGRENKDKYEACVMDLKKKFNMENINEEGGKLRSVKVTFSNGNTITTSMAAHLSDDDIRKYYAIGKLFNLGKGDKDSKQKVAKVDILDGVNESIDKSNENTYAVLSKELSKLESKLERLQNSKEPIHPSEIKKEEDALDILRGKVAKASAEEESKIKTQSVRAKMTKSDLEKLVESSLKQK
jgi:hypothetical protein